MFTPTAFISPLLPTTFSTSSYSLSRSSKNSFTRRIVVPRAALTPSIPSIVSTEDRNERISELEENQKLYIYKSPPTIPGIAFVQGPVFSLPGQSPTRKWLIAAGLAGVRVTLNFVNLNPVSVIAALRSLVDSIFVKKEEGAVDSAIQAYNDRINSDSIAKDVAKRFRSARTGSQFEEKNPILEPYRSMWNSLPFPKIGNVFLEDKLFARLRVAGYNPLSLVRVFSLADMPFTITDVNLPWTGDTVVRAIAENRLYSQDFSLFAGIKPDTDVSRLFVVTSAMYAIPPGGDDLMPVAIKVNGDDPIFPPKPHEPFSTHWAIAKLAVNQNDAMHHELVAHLGRTHLLVEPFVIATMRQLPSKHPVHVLLKPHMEGTIFINDTASKDLVAPGGDIDCVFAGDITSIMKWVGEYVVENNFNDSMPDVELKARGVMDPILNMPYRDDALEHFTALHEWVLAYVSHYYKTDYDVKSDTELQAWVRELVDPRQGRVKGFGEDGNGTVSTIKYLARALTFVIFSGSIQHAAVNYPQLGYMGYAPATPGALYKLPPKASEKAGLEEWVEALTPIKTAIDQIKILGILGGVYYTQLAQYRKGEMPKDKPIKAALRNYKEKLQKIDARIEKRERKSSVKYDFMRPGKIPQSINI